MVIYADILFAVNFIMDYIALYVCGKVLNFNIKAARLSASSAIGALYAVLDAVISMRTFTSIACLAAVSLIMCSIAYGYKSIAAFIKTVILFYAVNMLLGGIMTVIYNIAYKYRDADIFKNGITPQIYFAFVGIIFVFIVILGKIFTTFVYKKSVKANIEFDNCSKKFDLLCDTGNLLRDPYSDLPVIVLCADSLDGLLGKTGIHRRFDTASSDDAVKYKIRYIPVKTSAGSTLMPAIMADKISISGKNNRENEVKAVIAVDRFTKGSYGTSDGLIPYSLVSNF